MLADNDNLLSIKKKLVEDLCTFRFFIFDNFLDTHLPSILTQS
jgi:hypothetical protein